MDEEFHHFIQSSKATNTKYGNTVAYNALRRYMDNILNDNRNILSLEPKELDNLLGKYFMNATKLDGTPFEPDSLSTFLRGLNRYLEANKYGHNILQSELFNTSRQVLLAKRKQLTQQGGGNKPCATRELSEQEVDILFQEKYFGIENASSLVNVMWWLTSLHFGFRARNESRKMKWGDVVLESDTNTNIEFLEWGVERGTKTRIGLENEVKRAYSPRVYATSDDRCPVMIYKEFKRRRPSDACTDDSPLLVVSCLLFLLFLLTHLHAYLACFYCCY